MDFTDVRGVCKNYFVFFPFVYTPAIQNEIVTIGEKIMVIAFMIIHGISFISGIIPLAFGVTWIGCNFYEFITKKPKGAFHH